jgi:hypothetical protein
MSLTDIQHTVKTLLQVSANQVLSPHPRTATSHKTLKLKSHEYKKNASLYRVHGDPGQKGSTETRMVSMDVLGLLPNSLDMYKMNSETNAVGRAKSRAIFPMVQ